MSTITDKILSLIHISIIQEQFSMEIDHALFLFCGRKCDRIKAILKEPDGIVMIYKRPVSYTHLDVYKRQQPQSETLFLV